MQINLDNPHVLNRTCSIPVLAHLTFLPATNVLGNMGDFLLSVLEFFEQSESDVIPDGVVKVELGFLNAVTVALDTTVICCKMSCDVFPQKDSEPNLIWKCPLFTHKRESQKYFISFSEKPSMSLRVQNTGHSFSYSIYRRKVTGLTAMMAVCDKVNRLNISFICGICSHSDEALPMFYMALILQ